MASFKTIFYQPSKTVNTRVSFRFLGKNDKVIKEWIDYACFADVTYYPIPADVMSIEVFRDLEKIPYDKSFILKWINELNELGFPCSATFTNVANSERVLFILKLKDFSHKFLLNSTLQLIRCLFEYQICYVPDIYFDLLSKDNSADRFQILQESHYKLAYYDQSKMFNSNHTITSRGKGDGRPITKEEFLNRLKKTNYPLYADNPFGEYTSIHSLWCPIKLDK